MKKKIRFRVWDKENKIFLIRRQIELGDSKIWVYSLPPAENIEDGENTLEWCIECDEGFSVMQFTGLKDKNGKGIYEGDIIKQALNGSIKKVEWGNRAGFDLDDVFIEKWEVIGNVYENPELLK